MEAMQAKAISLNDLALLDVDVDQLLNKNEKTRSLSDEMRRSLHIRGRTAYAESLSSIDTDSQHSFSSHATSKSSRSNASSSISSVRSNSSSTSSRASNSKKGKVLARMSLTGIEAVAVAESKRKQAADLKKSMELNYVALKKKQQIDEQNQKQLLSNSFFNSIDDNSKDANRLQKKKQLIDGESLFSSVLKNDSNSDYEVDYISNYNKDDDEMNGTGINRSISKDSSDSNNRNSFNVIDINEDARRNSDNNKSPRNTPTKSYFSLKGIRKIAKRMIKGPSSTKHKINSTSEKKYHQQQQRQYDDDGIV